jgi:hypothetical protein
MGRPIYWRYGFVQVGDLLKVELKEFGVDMSFTMCQMGYFPLTIDEEVAEVIRE